MESSLLCAGSWAKKVSSMLVAPTESLFSYLSLACCSVWLSRERVLLLPLVFRQEVNSRQMVAKSSRGCVFFILLYSFSYHYIPPGNRGNIMVRKNCFRSIRNTSATTCGRPTYCPHVPRLSRTCSRAHFLSDRQLFRVNSCGSTHWQPLHIRDAGH